MTHFTAYLVNTACRAGLVRLSARRAIAVLIAAIALILSAAARFVLSVVSGMPYAANALLRCSDSILRGGLRLWRTSMRTAHCYFHYVGMSEHTHT